jgi:hypothetical protein
MRPLRQKSSRIRGRNAFETFQLRRTRRVDANSSFELMLAKMPEMAISARLSGEVKERPSLFCGCGPMIQLAGITALCFWIN